MLLFEVLPGFDFREVVVGSFFSGLRSFWPCGESDLSEVLLSLNSEDDDVSFGIFLEFNSPSVSMISKRLTRIGS